ncbi:MAG: HAD family phosphatase [Anaerotignum sp.]|nr:HAD family phosphatase [Anaerotignum sp.]
MIKLIVSDMDGTLVNDEKKIDESIYDVLPKLKEMGTRFVVASGRQYPSLCNDFKEHTKDVVICSENGAFIVDDGKELYARCMTKEQVKMSLDAAFAVEGMEPVVCAKYVTYTRSREMADFLASPKFNYKMALVDDLYNIDDDIIKVSMMVLNGEDTVAMFRKVRAVLDESMNLVTSGEGCMDSGIYGVNKGAAVEALQEMWGITPEETMVFGDQYNDVEMFDKAHYSFAMAGAMEGVKKKARFVTGSNNEGSVVKEIRKFTGI